MTTSAAFTARLDQTCTRKTFGGYNSRGDPSWSTSASTYPCRVEDVQHLVVNASGQEVVAKGKVFVGFTSTGGAPSFTVQDRVVMPDSTVPSIVAVETLRGRDGVHHQVVHYA